MAFRSIMVPHDFSAPADGALELALELARSAGARIRLVHVFPLPMENVSPYEIAMPERLVGEVRAAASERLERLLARVRAAGLEGDAEVDSGPVAETLVERARADGVDLIVMGTRGLSGIGHLLLGSVAERVLRTAPCPVLTVPAARPHE